MSAPNLVWCADFKGQFKTRDGLYCYPLTVTDGYSRYLLGCQALSSTTVAEAQPVFARPEAPADHERKTPRRERHRGRNGAVG
jgi:transposase InsO family protein